jgi:GNAT superfamily N-acetyltransferase
MDAQQFARDDLDDFLMFVSNNAAQRLTGRTYLMTSDVAWQFPGCAPKDNIRLWKDQNGLAAYAWFQPPNDIKFDVRFDIEKITELFSEMLDWAEHRRSEFPSNYPFYIDLDSMDEWADAVRNLESHPTSKDKYLVTSALETDERRLKLLGAHGFHTTKHFEPILTCDLRNAMIIDIPDSYTIHQVEQSEFEKRVELHSAAWAPASGFNMDQYLRVRNFSPIFDPALDIVAVAEDGAFASYTIAWIDPVSRIGSFEPFGTHPKYRGSGVSRAVIGEGFRRLKAKGMQYARIYTAGFNHQAKRLYESCGFTQIDVNRTILKQL